MNARTAISAAAFRADVPGAERLVFERQIAMLGELAEVGLEVVKTIRDQAVEAAAAPARIDFGLAYSRAAKAVRMTLALQRRYILDLKFQDRSGEPAPTASDLERVRRDLAPGGVDEAETLERLELALDAADALDEYEDLRDDIPDLPLDDLVAKICKDLGLPPDWRERRQAAQARAAAVAKPAQEGVMETTEPGCHVPPSSRRDTFWRDTS